eukprot:CAMPEP_0197582388 /NCGR_PEP_ID=MMETSP1326-20131121/5614_1 /TAXON_ID=1155430 /ORGANISM="Genus nov. species nov., Strain RCC2288" /LENGTH=81 /DNA_ID=CAMNT_0043146457 /DNA_START=69 /DNA_END=311 /DNA_ORIENTATION=-
MFAGESEEGLTEYELERVAHIRRNRAIMARLGLGDHDIVSAARQRCGQGVASTSSSKGAGGKAAAAASKKRERAPAGGRGE